MSDQDRWLLPEGVEEALPDQAERLEFYRRRLLDLYHSWGYELVIPPLIEYLESLLTGTSHDLDLQTFKLTDQLNGRMMGVRADMTPQVARIDAHVLKREAPVRLCYLGTVLRTRSDGVGSSRSPMQVGAELFGHAGIDSELEVIRLMLQTLRALGIEDIHLDLGHVGVFSWLARQAGLDTEQEFALFEMLQRKAVPEIEAYLGTLGLARDVRTSLAALAGLHGGEEVLSEARSRLAGGAPEVAATLDAMERLVERLRDHEPDLALHFDLAELRGYHYHTGSVFAAYVPGQGQEVARGGRYDHIGAVFGRARPATGFSTDLKLLCALSNHSAVPARSRIYVAAADVGAARARIEALRAEGERVVCALAGQSAGAREMGCERQLVKQADHWIIKDLQ
jgi:ATP phosphoribosyltransferase regulatory subunit